MIGKSWKVEFNQKNLAEKFRRERGRLTVSQLARKYKVSRIVARIVCKNYEILTKTKDEYAARVYRDRLSDKLVAKTWLLAKKTLDEQIRLARKEQKTAPLFRPSPREIDKFLSS